MADQITWVYWALAGSGFGILLMLAILIYDIFCRCRDSVVQNIFDGGPPSSPGHQFIYKVAIKAEEASSSFNVNQTVLKFEFLDHWHRYLGTIAVPAHLLKLNQEPDSSNSQNRDSISQQPRESASKDSQSGKSLLPPFQQQQQQQQAKAPEAYELRPKSESPYKSMTEIRESWSNTEPKQSTLSFQYIRRSQLAGLSFLRISHDCYNKNAWIKLKHFVIYDGVLKEYYKVSLEGKLLKALHVCPPARQQMYPIERVTNTELIGEIISLASASRRNDSLSACCK